MDNEKNISVTLKQQEDSSDEVLFYRFPGPSGYLLFCGEKGIDFVLPRAARPSHNGRVPAKSMNKRNPLFTRILFHFSGVRELACRRSGKIKRLRICRNLFYL